MNPPVKGRCPHGCGETLFLGKGGYVTCSWSECPDPAAASHVLASAAEKRDLLRRTAGAIHTLFYATERAGERYKDMEASIEGDAELAAFQALSVGLIGFDPLPPEALAGLRAKFEESQRREAERPTTPSDRITIDAHNSPEGAYFTRLLEAMYTRWQGTLEYEPGIHRLVCHSPFDEQLRRHSTFATVAVDGYAPDLHARTYILSPYLRVKDDRTKRESDDPWRVLGGDLTPILPEGENSQEGAR